MVFSLDFADAEAQFGKAMEKIKSELSISQDMTHEGDILENLRKVSQILTYYEKQFNQLAQANTDHRIQRTRLESGYQALVSSVLTSKKSSFLKPLFILTDFQMRYFETHRSGEYQAIQVVIDSIERNLSEENILDERTENYLGNYRKIIKEDYELHGQFQSLNKSFNETGESLAGLLSDISRDAETLLKTTFVEAETSRVGLKNFFFMSSLAGLWALLTILLIVAGKIVRPVRSVARVINDIKSGNTSSRFTVKGNANDEIVQLGVILNEMLDTIDRSKSQLLDYQKQLESKVSELDARQRERERLIEELETKNAELERFTYTVSHDLKSPLITIRGFLGFLEEDAASGDAVRVKSDISRITEATDKMRSMLDDLLELSRIGRLLNPLEEVEFGDIVNEALNMIAGRMKEKNIRIIMADDLPKVHGDRQRLREVVQNLLDNAVKYSCAQPSPVIEIGHRKTSEQDVFFIKDNGMGIDPKYQDKIFGLFEKLDPSVEGTGIGLAIAKRVIEIHGGHIWVESEGAGRGSTFCFTLPKKFD
jgi:signal transduction histidine kinase